MHTCQPNTCRRLQPYQPAAAHPYGPAGTRTHTVARTHKRDAPAHETTHGHSGPSACMSRMRSYHGTGDEVQRMRCSDRHLGENPAMTPGTTRPRSCFTRPTRPSQRHVFIGAGAQQALAHRAEQERLARTVFHTANSSLQASLPGPATARSNIMDAPLATQQCASNALHGVGARMRTTGCAQSQSKAGTHGAEPSISFRGSSSLVHTSNDSRGSRGRVCEGIASGYLHKSGRQAAGGRHVTGAIAGGIVAEAMDVGSLLRAATRTSSDTR